MLSRLYPGKYRPAPDERAVILARSSHAGFGKTIVKARSKTKPTLVKFLIKLFSKSLWGVGQSPTTCICKRKAWVYVPPLRGGVGNKKFAGFRKAPRPASVGAKPKLIFPRLPAGAGDNAAGVGVYSGRAKNQKA
jgi:hypothetical protein